MCFLLQCRYRQRLGKEENVGEPQESQKAVLFTADTDCPVTKKVLELSRRESWLKNISEIESHMQVIRNRRIDSGFADAMQDAMTKLQEQKEMLEELLYPKLWWNCTECTYMNSPVHVQCEMCESAKPTEITVEMFVNLKALLYNRIDDQKGITCLFTSTEQEEPKVRIKKLKRQVSELSSQHHELSERLNELGNNNTILADKIAEDETILKTCIDLRVVDPMQWSVGMVSVWLLRLGIQQYQKDFKDACIDGEKLLNCNDISLEKLHVRQKHCPLILNAIADLKTKRKNFNLGIKHPSVVQAQPSNAVCEDVNVQKFTAEKGIKVSRKSLEAGGSISGVVSADGCTYSLRNFSDEEWEKIPD